MRKGKKVYWEKNKEILQKKYPGLLEELSSHSGDFPHDIKIETAPTGDPTLNINGLHVHSPRDPAKEGQRLSQTVEAGAGAAVILGFGLGYAAHTAAHTATKTGRPVIVIEKYGKLLRQAFELRDFTEFLNAKNIFFIVGGAGDGIVNALGIVNELIKNDDNERPAPTIIRNKALIDLDSEWYKNIEDKIRTWTMKDKVNTATLKRFGKRWVRNLSSNMSAIRDYPGVARLSGLAAEDGSQRAIPIFLAAAGPSLDKVKPLLRDIYERCIVVAVDTNLRFFLQNGIQPDFVLTVDPQFWNSRHLDRCVCEKTTLIAESAVYPPVLHLPFKRKFLCGSLFPLGSFIETRADPKGRLGAGGSVATTACDFVRQIAGGREQGAISKEQVAMSNEQGAMSREQRAESREQRTESKEQRGGRGEVWVGGLDLGFPGLKTHFRGARFEEKANSESNRFNPAETWVVRVLRDGIPFKARSCAGGQVLTDRRLSLYAAWFENQFNQHAENINYLALFQEGLAITGLRAGNAERLLALPVRRDEIDTRLNERYAQIDAEFDSGDEKYKRAQKYENAVGSLLCAFKSIEKAAGEGKSAAQRALEGINANSLSAAGREKAVKDLEMLTRRIAESEVKEIAGFLLPTEENEIADTSGANDPFRAYLQSSIKLFSSLLETSDFYLGLIN